MTNLLDLGLIFLSIIQTIKTACDYARRQTIQGTKFKVLYWFSFHSSPFTVSAFTNGRCSSQAYPVLFYHIVFGGEYPKDNSKCRQVEKKWLRWFSFTFLTWKSMKELYDIAVTKLLPFLIFELMPTYFFCINLKTKDKREIKSMLKSVSF